MPMPLVSQPHERCSGLLQIKVHVLQKACNKENGMESQGICTYDIVLFADRHM